MTPQDKKEIEKLIDLITRNNFSKRIGDTPTDSLQLTNRKYVNLYGTTANRPSVVSFGQQYFDTNLNYPIYRSPNSSVWTNSVGSVV